jgi:ankyrin repeat protein
MNEQTPNSRKKKQRQPPGDETMLLSLPNEILNVLMCHLGPEDTASMCASCRTLQTSLDLASWLGKNYSQEAFRRATFMASGQSVFESLVRQAKSLGLNVNAPDGDGKLPLEYACKEGYLEVASLLLRVSSGVMYLECIQRSIHANKLSQS